MRLRRGQRREDPEINITPLIDVVFLLLIFFMVTTTFREQAGLEITLPEAESKPPEAAGEQLEIGVSAEGELFVGGEPVVNRKLDTLVRALEEAGAPEAVEGIVVRADAEAPHQAVVRALDGAGRVGAEQVSVAALPPDQE